MGERATRVGVKLEPPTLIVIYALDDKSRIRKIPLKMTIDGKRADDIVDALMSRQNHATLLRSIKRDTLLNVIGKLPGAIFEPVATVKTSPIEDNIDDLLGMVTKEEKPKPKFTMPLLSASEGSDAGDSIEDLLRFTSKAQNQPEPEKEKTKFSFLDSDDDDFRPLPQADVDDEDEQSEKSRVSTPSSKSSVASWLKSTENDKTEKDDNYDDDEFSTKTTSSTHSEVESELEEQVINDNPYLANLQASAAAARRGSTASSLSDSESSLSQSELNYLSDDALKKAKAKMEVGFAAAQLKPDDSNFVYDKQNEFAPTETCDWDDSVAD